MDESDLEHPPIVSSVKIYEDQTDSALCRLTVNFDRQVEAVRVDEKVAKALRKLSIALEAYEHEWDLLLESAQENEEEATPRSTIGKFFLENQPGALEIVNASPLSVAFNKELEVIGTGIGCQLGSHRWGGGVIHYAKWIVDYCGPAVVEDDSVVGGSPHYERHPNITVRVVLDEKGKAIAVIIDRKMVNDEGVAIAPDVGLNYSFPDESKEVSVRFDKDPLLEKRVNLKCRCFDCEWMREEERKKSGGDAKRGRVEEDADEEDY